jgi:hypothetical protein
MIDRTTKIILAAIAMGLWGNLFVSAFPVTPARAGIGSDISDMAHDLHAIASGICVNGKLC